MADKESSAKLGGIDARKKGYSKIVCPYPNHEVTMEFRRLWFEGWDEEDDRIDRELSKDG